jgi:hypothetical protein
MWTKITNLCAWPSRKTDFDGDERLIDLSARSRADRTRRKQIAPLLMLLQERRRRVLYHRIAGLRDQHE